MTRLFYHNCQLYLNELRTPVNRLAHSENFAHLLLIEYNNILWDTFADKEPLSIFSNPRASTQSARPIT